jgi:hypothetical protein
MPVFVVMNPHLSVPPTHLKTTRPGTYATPRYDYTPPSRKSGLTTTPGLPISLRTDTSRGKARTTHRLRRGGCCSFGWEKPLVRVLSERGPQQRGPGMERARNGRPQLRGITKWY